jgi:hypothetical protein
MPIYEVVISGGWMAQLWQSKLHFDVQSADDAQSLCAIIAAQWIGEVRLAQTANVTYTLVTARKLSGGVLDQASLPLAVTGAHSPENQFVPFVAVVMHKRTGLSGRANRGRVHFPGVRQGTINLGTLTIDGVNEWNTVASVLLQRFGPSSPFNIHLVIHHTIDGGTTAVQTLACSPVLGPLATRKVGRGA